MDHSREHLSDSGFREGASSRCPSDGSSSALSLGWRGSGDAPKTTPHLSKNCDSHRRRTTAASGAFFCFCTGRTRKITNCAATVNSTVSGTPCWRRTKITTSTIENHCHRVTLNRSNRSLSRRKFRGVRATLPISSARALKQAIAKNPERRSSRTGDSGHQETRTTGTKFHATLRGF